MCAQVRDGARDLLRRGPQGLGGAPPPWQVPGKGPQRAGGADDRRGRQTAGVGGTGAMRHRAALEDLATGEVLPGSQAQPGAAVGGIGPLAPGGTDRGSQGLRQGIAPAVDGHESATGDAQERGAARSARRGLLAVRVGLAPGGVGAAGEVIVCMPAHGRASPWEERTRWRRLRWRRERLRVRTTRASGPSRALTSGPERAHRGLCHPCRTQACASTSVQGRTRVTTRLLGLHA